MSSLKGNFMQDARFDKNMFQFRHDFMRSLRSFLDTQDFVEIETPFLITANTPDPYIDPIIALLEHAKKSKMQLRTSPELWLKKAIALGMPKIYELARVFRDDPPGNAHHREFTMLEWYRVGASLDDLIDDCAQIFDRAARCAYEHFGHPQPSPISFNRESVSNLFKTLAHIDLDQVLSQLQSGQHDALQVLLKARGEHIPDQSSFTDAFFHVMLKYIEPKLNPEQPTVIARWPVQLAALAAPCLDDPRYCGRFEIYYGGLEIANAYDECNDPTVLLNRFQAENKLRASLGREEFPIDYAFLRETERMPATAGIALGVDRLLQATMKITQISDLIFGEF